MCQPKDKGGKRCAAHMSGSMATVSMSSIMSGIKEAFVRNVFSSLNKEGKHLPMPSEEEIVAFARNNQFISRHDVTIPDNKRAMLVKRWQKAELERPGGGTFHAWKHTLVESVVRWRRTAAVATLGGVLAFTSACSGGAIDNSPVPTSSPTSISQSAEPTPSASPSATSQVPAGFGTAAPAGKAVESPNGSYVQSTIKDDDPAMTPDPSLFHESVASTDPAEIKAAQQAIVKFTAEEGIDSRLNGDGMTKEEWWASNKDKIHPAFQDSIRSDMESGKSFVMDEAWQASYAGKYDYSTDPANTRIYDRTITPKVVWSPSPGTIAVQMDVSYKIPVTPGVGKTGTGIQTTAGTMSYSATKGPNGNWLIDGYQHEIQTTEG